jgi:lysophospholipid acyltransferase (LPLAT)-like uncharacterized protein
VRLARPGPGEQLTPRGWQRIAPLCALLYRAYHRTLRLRGSSESGDAFDPRSYEFPAEIWALCERDTLALAGLAAARGFTVLVALGADGDWAAAVLTALGCKVVRGSSRRGGWTALRRLLSQLESGSGPLAVVVDGPLGPDGRVRPGALVCSQWSGRPLRVVAAHARYRVRFPGTWSGIYLPLPFAKVAIALARPLQVPATAALSDLDRWASEVEHRLAGARSDAAPLARTA